MSKNKLIRPPSDAEVVSSFAKQYQVIKAKKKQQPVSRQSSAEEAEKPKVNGEGVMGELMKSKVLRRVT